MRGKPDSGQERILQVLPCCLDVVAHRILGYPRGERHCFEEEAVRAVDPVVFGEFYDAGLLEGAYSTLMPGGSLDAFLSSPENSWPQSACDARDVFRIWFAAAAVCPDCELTLEEGVSPAAMRLARPAPARGGARGRFIEAGDIEEWKRRLGVDIMLGSWHSGIPLDAVLGLR